MRHIIVLLIMAGAAVGVISPVERELNVEQASSEIVVSDRHPQPSRSATPRPVISSDVEAELLESRVAAERRLALIERRKELRAKRLERQRKQAAAERRQKELEASQTPTPTPTPTPSKTPKPTPQVASLSDIKQYALNKVGAEQFECLNLLWEKESGWDMHADNPNSDAYGIPQAMTSVHDLPADYYTNAYSQVDWGIQYITDTYGTACAAWAHSQANNWY